MAAITRDYTVTELSQIPEPTTSLADETDCWIKNNFIVDFERGRGSFGSVWKVRGKTKSSPNASNCKCFAIKSLVQTNIPKFIAMELTVLRKFGGKNNILKLFAAHRSADKVFIVMEFFPHYQFRDYVYLMNGNEVLDYVKNLLIALEYLHKNGIVHRDVKPSNFLYNRDLRKYALIDFGLSQEIHSPAIVATRSTTRKRTCEASSRKSPVKRLKIDKENDQNDVKSKRSLFVVKEKSKTRPVKQSSLKCDCAYSTCNVCEICKRKETEPGSRAGTAGFRAPELLLKPDQCSPAMDIWATARICEPPDIDDDEASKSPTVVKQKSKEDVRNECKDEPKGELTKKESDLNLTAASIAAVDAKFDETETKVMLVSNRMKDVTALREHMEQIGDEIPQNRQKEASLLFLLSLQEVQDAQRALIDACDAFRLTLEVARGPRPSRTQPLTTNRTATLDLMDKLSMLYNKVEDEDEDEESSEESEDEDDDEDGEYDESSYNSDSTVPSPTITESQSTTKLTNTLPPVTRSSSIEKIQSDVPKTVARTDKEVVIKKKIVAKRHKLPAVSPPPGSFRLSQVLQRPITLPIDMFEPVGILQIGAEEMRFSQLLDKATKENDPANRMAYIMAFAISPYGNTIHRARKPFNPLMFETYELDKTEDLGWKYFSEQVSHHPDITATHTEGNGWVCWQTVRFQLKPNVLSLTVEITPDPDFNTKLHLVKFNEIYTWTKVKSIVKSALRPSLRFLSHEGWMDVRCNSGVRGRTHFEKWSKERHRHVQGLILQGANATTCMGKIEGQWAGDIYLKKGNDKICIFKATNFFKENRPTYYGFSPFTMELNELTDDMVKRLPPTDTRLRPDQRLMEEGKFTEAHNKKNELENKQRQRRQRLEKGLDGPRQPLWFVADQNSTGNKKGWIWNKKYWTEKENGFKGIDFLNLFNS